MPKASQKQHTPAPKKSVEELVEELFKSSEDELLNPEIPFNKVVFLEKLPDSFNKESKTAHDKFARLQGVGIPLFHRDGLVEVRQADERQPSWPRTSTKMAGGPRRREGVARP
jgi:hypothetical protein